MKTASIRLIIDKNDSDIPMSNVTPAEVQLLCTMHSGFVGKLAVMNLKESGEVKRDDLTEVARLRSKYGKKRVEELFGKVNPRLPVDFKAALLTPGEDEKTATEDDDEKD